MKIIEFGTLKFIEGAGPIIQDWQVEREADDPADATNEQLLLSFVLNWAKKKFDTATNDATLRGLRAEAARRREANINAVRGSVKPESI